MKNFEKDKKKILLREYSEDYKYFDETNNKGITKFKGASSINLINEFNGLRPEICSYSVDYENDGTETFKKAKKKYFKKIA